MIFRIDEHKASAKTCIRALIKLIGFFAFISTRALEKIAFKVISSQHHRQIDPFEAKTAIDKKP